MTGCDSPEGLRDRLGEDDRRPGAFLRGAHGSNVTPT